MVIFHPKNVYGIPNIPNKYVNKPQDAHEE